VTLRARWVTLRARWVTLSARWVTLRARLVTLRARWVTLSARWVTLSARWVTLSARWVTLSARGGDVQSAALVTAALGRAGVDTSFAALGAVYANELEFDAQGVSTGNIVHRVKGPLDKKIGFMGARASPCLAASSPVYGGAGSGWRP
jgi:hypothetical protein